MPPEKSVHTSEGLDWYRELPASPAVRIGDILAIAGQVPLDKDMNVVAAGDVAGQSRSVFDSIGRLLESAGGTFDDVVDVIAFAKDPRDLDPIFDVAGEYFVGAYPAWSAAAFLGSYTSDVLVSVRVIAHLGTGPKECYTPESLRWWGERPASGGCKKGELLFVSAQSATDADGNVLYLGDHCGQARHAYASMLEIVEMAGGSVDDIIDFTSFHQDIRGAEATLLEVYGAEVLSSIPSEQVASTSHIGTPGLERVGMLGCYRAIADLTPGPRIASTPDNIWWKEVLPVAGGAKKKDGHVITIAGQVASAADGSIVARGDIAGQARYELACIKDVLEGFDVSMDSVLEVMSFHKDPRAWETVMKVGTEFFSTEAGPAWTPISIPGLWVEGYLHEIAALAIV
jgi:aminoacrylate peracid reductase